MNREQIIGQILTESDRGLKFGKFASDHEMYAVLLEEVEEVWTEIKNNKEVFFELRLQKELIQVCAVALRAIEELQERIEDENE